VRVHATDGDKRILLPLSEAHIEGASTVIKYPTASSTTTDNWIHFGAATTATGLFVIPINLPNGTIVKGMAINADMLTGSSGSSSVTFSSRLIASPSGNQSSSGFYVAGPTETITGSSLGSADYYENCTFGSPYTVDHTSKHSLNIEVRMGVTALGAGTFAIRGVYLDIEDQNDIGLGTDIASLEASFPAIDADVTELEDTILGFGASPRWIGYSSVSGKAYGDYSTGGGGMGMYGTGEIVVPIQLRTAATITGFEGDYPDPQQWGTTFYSVYVNESLVQGVAEDEQTPGAELETPVEINTEDRVFIRILHGGDQPGSLTGFKMQVEDLEIF